MLIRTPPWKEPYSSPIPRGLWRSYGGGRFLISEVPLYDHLSALLSVGHPLCLFGIAYCRRTSGGDRRSLSSSWSGVWGLALSIKGFECLSRHPPRPYRRFHAYKTRLKDLGFEPLKNIETLIKVEKCIPTRGRVFSVEGLRFQP